MKNITFLILSLLFMSLACAQGNALKITNVETGKEKIIHADKYIRIKTTAGEKFSGRLQIVDNQTIFIAEQEFKLANIEKIKRHPLLISTVSNFFLIYTGSLVIGLSALIAVFGAPAAAFGIIPGTAMVYFGTTSPNLLKSYKVSSGWAYEIITVTK
jgi:small nuclear ribonucleoprotein (snRNP)-like protein